MLDDPGATGLEPPAKGPLTVAPGSCCDPHGFLAFMRHSGWSRAFAGMIRVLVAGVASVVLFARPSTAWAQSPGTDLTIAMSHAGNFTVGVNGVHTIAVSNIGGTASSGQIIVNGIFGKEVSSDPFTFVSVVGTGWSCSYEPAAEFLLCSSSSVVTPGGSAAPITLTVIPCCTGTLKNVVSVSGGSDTPCADVICMNHKIARDPTIVVAAVPMLPEGAMIALTVLLAVAGIAAQSRRATA